MNVVDYNIIGTENQEVIDKTHVMVNEGYFKYNLLDDASLVVEYGDENTLTLLNSDDVEEPLGDEHYNIMHLEDEYGKIDIALVNKNYIGENIVDLSFALGNLLAEQYLTLISSRDIEEYDEVVQAILFAFSAYLSCELIEISGNDLDKEKLKYMFIEPSEEFNKFIESEEQCNICKINSLLEYIGYNYKYNKTDNMTNSLNSSHITIKTIEKLRIKLFEAFNELLNLEVLNTSIIDEVSKLLDTLINII